MGIIVINIIYNLIISIELMKGYLNKEPTQINYIKVGFVLFAQ